MRKKGKFLTVAMCALVAALGVNATLAWLTDKTETVTNTFSPSDINITLTESDADNDQNANANAYKMVPGSVIVKDPVATVEAGSEPCWLFVQVQEVGGNVDLNDDGATDTTFGDFIGYSVEDAWTQLGTKSTTGVSTYYMSVAASDAAQSYRVLTDNQVTVNDEVTKEMMDALEANQGKLPKLTFKAFAVQQANISDANGNGSNVDEAWDQIPAEEKLS